MPALAFLFLIVFGSIPAVFCWFIEHWCRWLIAPVMTLLWAGSVAWCIAAGIQPAEIEQERCYQVQDITFPNGTKAQYINCDGKNVDVSKCVGAQIQPGYMVKVTTYKKIYLWVDYSSVTSSVNKDSYSVVKEN